MALVLRCFQVEQFLSVFAFVSASQSFSSEFFAGEFCDDKRHGRGILRLSTGERYDGGFADDTFHGLGVLVTRHLDKHFNFPHSFLQVRADGSKQIGVWEKGVFQGDKSRVA